LAGEDKKRYFADKKAVTWVNGKEKNDEFKQELEESEFIFLNFEQLLTDFTINGETKKVYQVLQGLGYDHLIIDEVQEAKNTRTCTKKGGATESFAVRLLATNVELEYLTLLSGTPMPDNLNDYANIFFMLKPEYFLREEEVNGEKVKKLDFENVKKRFYQIYEGDPRALYTLVKQNTIRRTSQQVSDLPGYDLIEEDVELTPVQRKIMDYVFEHSKKDWLIQMRYAALDPRLVSPTILREMDLIGKLTREDSAKYARLEEILSAEDGPIAKGEKVVIFSSMFAEGVTRSPDKLYREYLTLGIEEEFGYETGTLENKIISQFFSNGDKELTVAKLKKLSKKKKLVTEAIKVLKDKEVIDVEKGTVKLRSKYCEVKLLDEYEKLGIHNLKDDLVTYLENQFGRDIELASIDADTDTEEREWIVDNLNNGLDGVLATTKSGGVSLNFSAASTEVFLDRPYSPAPEDQGIARVVRRGQRRRAIIYFLNGKDSIDYDVRDLVENKRQNIMMALDGIELQDKEKDVLWGKKDKEKLKDLFLRRRGGMSVDLSEPEIDSIDAFDSKRVVRRGKRKSPNLELGEGMYEQSVAQEIRKVIANDPINCWHDEDFVNKYTGNFEQLAPYLLSQAKVVNLLKRSLSGELEFFPELLLSDAAGHGVLYSAFQDLEKLVIESGFKMPLIIDRDFSRPMHTTSPNPQKYLADMCGQERIFDEDFFDEFGKFDFVDNSSITLLPNKRRIRDYILETNRIIDLGGYLQLGIRGWLFDKKFFEGMKRSGFEPIVRSNRHFVSPDFRKFLKEQFGQHFAEAYASKLSATNFSIFQKVEEVNSVDHKYFLLEDPAHEEDDEEEEGYGSVDEKGAEQKDQAGKVLVHTEGKGYVRKKKSSGNGSSKPAFTGKGSRKEPKVYTGDLRLRVGPDGVVHRDERDE